MDEIVEVQMRMASATKTFARQRRNQVIWPGLAVMLTAPLAFLYRIEQEYGHAPPMSFMVGVVTASVVSGMVVAYLTARYFDWRVARYVRRVLNERHSGAAHVRLEIETRLEGLWCRSNGIEATIPWSQLTRTHDAPDAVEFWFSSPALFRLPSRAFSSDGKRQQMLRAVKTLAPQVQQTSSAHTENADR